MPDVHDRIGAVLADAAFDDPACEDSRDDTIWALVDAFGWAAVRDEMLALLADDGAGRDWAVASAVIWRGVDRPMPANRVIALLHHRLMADLPADQALDGNLVWSITRNLKAVSYLSDYEPLSDPDVQAELARLRRSPPA